MDQYTLYSRIETVIRELGQIKKCVFRVTGLLKVLGRLGIRFFFSFSFLVSEVRGGGRWV